MGRHPFHLLEPSDDLATTHTKLASGSLRSTSAVVVRAVRRVCLSRARKRGGLTVATGEREGASGGGRGPGRAKARSCLRRSLMAQAVLWAIAIRRSVSGKVERRRGLERTDSGPKEARERLVQPRTRRQGRGKQLQRVGSDCGARHPDTFGSEVCMPLYDLVSFPFRHPLNTSDWPSARPLYRSMHSVRSVNMLSDRPSRTADSPYADRVGSLPSVPPNAYARTRSPGGEETDYSVKGARTVELRAVSVRGRGRLV